MWIRRLFFAAAAVALAAGLPTKARAWGIDWQDTYLSYRQLWQDTQPGTSGVLQEHAGNISYANGWTYGSNFVSLDFEDFGNKDPANCVFSCKKASNNSFELYSVFRTVLSGNKIFNTNIFSFGPVRDVGWELGFDVDTQDDQFASYKKLIITGPQFSFAMPKGFWTFTVAVSHEWNTNAFLADNYTSFDPTYEFETAWLYPFNIGPVPLRFEGYANFIGPKGKGGVGDFYHRAEILLHPKLMVDVGQLINYGPNKIEAGFGFEYWHNKFGSVPQALSGTEQTAFFAEVGYHF